MSGPGKSKSRTITLEVTRPPASLHMQCAPPHFPEQNPSAQALLPSHMQPAIGPHRHVERLGQKQRETPQQNHPEQMMRDLREKGRGNNCQNQSCSWACLRPDQCPIAKNQLFKEDSLSELSFHSGKESSGSRESGRTPTKTRHESGSNPIVPLSALAEDATI